MKNQPVLVIMSVLAALQVLVAGSATLEFVPASVSQAGGLVVAALTVGMGFYIRGKVTPVGSDDME